METNLSEQELSDLSTYYNDAVLGLLDANTENPRPKINSDFIIFDAQINTTSYILKGTDLVSIFSENDINADEVSKISPDASFFIITRTFTAQDGFIESRNLILPISNEETVSLTTYLSDFHENGSIYLESMRSDHANNIYSVFERLNNFYENKLESKMRFYAKNKQHLIPPVVKVEKPEIDTSSYTRINLGRVNPKDMEGYTSYVYRPYDLRSPDYLEMFKPMKPPISNESIPHQDKERRKLLQHQYTLIEGDQQTLAIKIEEGTDGLKIYLSQIDVASFWKLPGDRANDDRYVQNLKGRIIDPDLCSFTEYKGNSNPKPCSITLEFNVDRDGQISGVDAYKSIISTTRSNNSDDQAVLALLEARKKYRNGIAIQKQESIIDPDSEIYFLYKEALSLYFEQKNLEIPPTLEKALWLIDGNPLMPNESARDFLLQYLLEKTIYQDSNHFRYKTPLIWEGIDEEYLKQIGFFEKQPVNYEIAERIDFIKRSEHPETIAFQIAHTKTSKHMINATRQILLQNLLESHDDEYKYAVIDTITKVLDRRGVISNAKHYTYPKNSTNFYSELLKGYLLNEKIITLASLYGHTLRRIEVNQIFGHFQQEDIKGLDLSADKSWLLEICQKLGYTPPTFYTTIIDQAKDGTIMSSFIQLEIKGEKYQTSPVSLEGSSMEAENLSSRLLLEVIRNEENLNIVLDREELELRYQDELEILGDPQNFESFESKVNYTGEINNLSNLNKFGITYSLVYSTQEGVGNKKAMYVELQITSPDGSNKERFLARAQNEAEARKAASFLALRNSTIIRTNRTNTVIDTQQAENIELFTQASEKMLIDLTTEVRNGNYIGILNTNFLQQKKIRAFKFEKGKRGESNARRLIITLNTGTEIVSDTYYVNGSAKVLEQYLVMEVLKTYQLD